MEGKKPPPLCPSSDMSQSGATVIGVVMEDGEVAFTAKPIPVDDAFREVAAQGRDPRNRFRFSSPCKKCSHYSNNRCGIADAVADEFGASPPVELPACPIRPTCLWYSQRGA